LGTMAARLGACTLLLWAALALPLTGSLRLPATMSRRAAVSRMAASPVSDEPAVGGGDEQQQSAVDPAADWGGLPAAIVASKCGAINSQIVKSANAEAVLQLTVKHAEQLNSVNAATALHRIAGHLKRSRAQRDRVLRDERFESLLDTNCRLAARSNPRSISDIMWAFATLQHWPPRMLKPVLTQVAVHLEANAFEAQHLALIVWAFAVLELKPVKLLERIETAALSQLKYFNEQNCANVLWGFAKLNYKPRTLLGPMSAKLLQPSVLRAMKPVEVTDASYALAVVGSREEQKALMAALATRAQPDTLLAKFSSRQLVMLTWAFARMQIRPEQLGLWVTEIRAAHERQPLLAVDARNLERALERFGEDTEWLHPPKEEEEEAAAA